MFNLNKEVDEIRLSIIRDYLEVGTFEGLTLPLAKFNPGLLS